VISQHYSAKLSENDLQMAIHIPPGGNWKNIPLHVPSKRLEQIRSSFAAGEGSRSTYYGRLHPDAPSYTINTYFNRPGNGCHLHYDYKGGQHRVISQREAARLQSFPDDFVFYGKSQNSINSQIGNAVPPLLAYQIAKMFPFQGYYIDLFSGAGGLSLGFKWAGWKPIIGNDIDSTFLNTYKNNVHSAVFEGDIREQSVFEAIVDAARTYSHKDIPLFVLGGPPCQGFSTAGNRRSMEDPRNHLFKQYIEIIKAIKPNGFVFENVTGLLNMQNGRVFEMVKSELSQVSSTEIKVWKLQAEQYGIPQRRTRVFMIGGEPLIGEVKPPERCTQYNHLKTLFDDLAPAISVAQALSDLPPISNGEDGSNLSYLRDAVTSYQQFVRGNLLPQEYIERLRTTNRPEEPQSERTEGHSTFSAIHRLSGS
jgi:DNA (cytosine-5)-methyltransferase 1